MKQQKIAAIVCSCLVLAGCECVKITDQDRTELESLHQRGIAWSTERDAGKFNPVVSMGAAVGWSFLPGAGQYFIAHKIEDAIAEGRLQDPRAPIWASSLRSEGLPMLIFSWIPYVYDFTHPCGTAGVIVDVNRINNIALREEVARRAVPE